MVTKPERSSYTLLDFRGWHDTDSLVLSPKFQRRGVWSTPARSYLIDTILLGMPIPPIYLRMVQTPRRDRVIREVIDGQQRIAAVLDYVADKYALSSGLESDAAGKRFSQLTSKQQDQIRHYSFICEVFHGVEDSDVLQIFARMNTHSVKLNAQELRNGHYFGLFKMTAYALAFGHLEFWRRHRIFTEMRIARMAEVELTSELMILALDGLQDKKKSVDEFYNEYDGKFPGRRTIESRFRNTIDIINTVCQEVLSAGEFRRPPLFYTLYGAVYHRLYGVPGMKSRTPSRGRLSSTEAGGLSDAILKLSQFIALAKSEDEDDEVPRTYARFVGACLRQTDNIKPRQTRLETLYRQAFRS